MGVQEAFFGYKFYFETIRLQRGPVVLVILIIILTIIFILALLVNMANTLSVHWNLKYHWDQACTH